MPFGLKHLFTCRFLTRSNSGLYFYNVIKLSYILNPSTPSQVNKLGSFKRKKVIRTEDLTCLLENVDFMFSLLHVYLYNLYNCHKMYIMFNDNKILNLNLNLLLLLMGEYIYLSIYLSIYLWC